MLFAKKIEGLGRFMFYAFVLLFPLQIGTLVADFNDVGLAFKRPYLMHFLYLADVFLVLSAASFALLKVVVNIPLSPMPKQFWLWVFAYFGVLSLGLLPTVTLDNSVFYFLRGVSFLVAYMIIAFGFVDLKIVKRVFLCLVTFSAVIGLGQVIFGSSWGLYMIGESHLSLEMTGVAKTSVFGVDVLRAYGLFLHPNIFAAYLLFAVAILLNEDLSWRKWILPLLLVAMVLTFSRSGLIALCVLFAFDSKWRVWALPILSLLVVVFIGRFLGEGGENFSERLVYLDISVYLLKVYPFGVGLGNFTLMMAENFPVTFEPWLLQPVHNAYLLFLNEFGLIAGVVFAFGVYSVLRKKSPYRNLLLAVLTLFLFDHYFLSLPSGQYLLFMLAGLYLK